MELAIFAKKGTTTDSTRTFTRYLTKLPRKDGTEQTMSVKFRESCGAPRAEECPCNIVVERENMNATRSEFEKEDGSVYTSVTLWVNKWAAGSTYIDHSLDEYDI